MAKVYLVTGAAGFLGGTVCRQLVAQGERVRAFVLPGDRAMQFVPREAEIVEGDLCDRESLEPLFSGAEGGEPVVLHIASIVTVDPGFNQKVMDVNVGGTRNVIELCRSYGASRLVYCSSTGCIPELPKGQAIREVGHFSKDGLIDCYSQSKAEATQAVLDAAAAGLDACVVHPTGILGPGDFAVGETTRSMIQIINGELPAGIDGSFNLADVRDLADGIIRAAEKGRAGECYILGNDEVSFRDFSRIVSEQSGCRRMRFFMPIRVAYFMAGLMERQARRRGKRPLMTSYSVYNLARNNVFDSSKARQELGYRTRSYEETLRDEIRWLRDMGKIA